MPELLSKNGCNLLPTYDVSNDPEKVIVKSKYGQNCLISPPYKYFKFQLKNKKVTDFLEILAFFWPNFSRAAIILQ